MLSRLPKVAFVICLKKMPSLVDKSTIKNICIDDFAFRKRYSYGTVMVDLDTHRIVDIIDTRETTEVATWLKTYPNLEVISRDGAQTYASAAMNACPHAIQVSDLFHLLKNLSEAAERYMRRLFPSRLEIPATASSRTPEMQALYNTRNRGERIRFAQAKRKEGYTINDIALLLHAATTTVQRYLAIDAEQIPSDIGTAREREHLKDIARKQAAIKEVKKLYPILGSLYFLLKEFHRIVFSQKSEELVTWIKSAESLDIDEITTYVNGLKNDIQAVKNGIKYKFDNGLAEGSVNKIKLIKRIMYGRNSFELLKAKVLLNELQN